MHTKNDLPSIVRDRSGETGAEKGGAARKYDHGGRPSVTMPRLFQNYLPTMAPIPFLGGPQKSQ
jgi:hypothetical protein